MAPPATTVQVVPPGKLVYGMQLPIVAQSSLFAAPWEAEAGTDELRRIAEACDRSGFFYLGVCDHVCVPRARAAAMSTAWHDTVATLGFLAAATRHVRLLSRPVQRPRPPIWVGGSTRAALRRAAERGDGWLPQGTPRAELPAQIAYLRAHRARVRGDAPIEIGAISEFCYVGTPRFDVPPNTRTGRGEAVAAGLRELRAIGVSHCGVRFRVRSCDELVEQIEAFAAEVAPHLGD